MHTLLLLLLLLLLLYCCFCCQYIDTVIVIDTFIATAFLTDIATVDRNCYICRYCCYTIIGVCMGIAIVIAFVLRTNSTTLNRRREAVSTEGEQTRACKCWALVPMIRQSSAYTCYLRHFSFINSITPIKNGLFRSNSSKIFSYCEVELYLLMHSTSHQWRRVG